jgi:hypothetical protein
MPLEAARTKKWECPENCPKKIGPQIANEKTTELLPVKLDKNLYLSVVRRTFDIKVFLPVNGAHDCDGHADSRISSFHCSLRNLRLTHSPNSIRLF